MAKKKPKTKRVAGKKKRASKKSRPAKKPSAKKKLARRKGRARRGKAERAYPVALGEGTSSAGQSGDTQGLSRREEYDSESVRELVEEGQYLEADAVSGVENARDPDQGEVTTREVPEDDVPEEYKDQD